MNAAAIGAVNQAWRVSALWNLLKLTPSSLLPRMNGRMTKMYIDHYGAALDKTASFSGGLTPDEPLMHCSSHMDIGTPFGSLFII